MLTASGDAHTQTQDTRQCEKKSFLQSSTPTMYTGTAE